ncbi:MAG: DUF1116 domain-containing protein [Endomicrobiia bacterium]
MTKLKIANFGARWFYESLTKQKNVEVVQINWSPGGKSKKVYQLLDKFQHNKVLQKNVEQANKDVIKKLSSAAPFLVGIDQAYKVVPDMDKNTILHAGPPIKFEEMCGPMKGAVIGAIIYEGLAKDEHEAQNLAKSGKIKFDSCHNHNIVGPMAGIVSASMPVWILKNLTFNNYAYATLNEGLGKVLRFGAYSEDVIKRLKWMEEILFPVLKKTIDLVLINGDGIDIKTLTAQALTMGDECHNRNIAATNLFLKEILPYLIDIEIDKKTFKDVVNFISSNPHFYLNISMAACKCSTDTIEGTKFSSVIYTLARNGVTTGIRVSGLPKKWFVAPSDVPKGLYFSGYQESDGNPDLGDSTVSEVAGIGAFAMACAPAIVKFVGGTPDDAQKNTLDMYKICVGEHPNFLIPQFNFRGTPLGVDIIKVLDTGITPIINTGIAHKKAGIGQIGAGILSAPMKCFVDAFEDFMREYCD